MSNNKNAKPAMSAVVSAAQKSVNNNHASQNALNKSNAFNVTNIVTTRSPQKENVLQSENPIKNAIDTITKAQKELVESTAEVFNKVKDSMPKSSGKQNNASDALGAENFNAHMVSILCDGIRNIHNQSVDFSEKLRQRRAEKEKSLSEIQVMTCDNVTALSAVCIDAACSSLKSKNPADIIKNQTKVITQVQQIYANMFMNFSKSSIDMMRCNFSNAWLNSKKK